jgi:putative peptidoglycan lipid II flippase
MAFFALGDVITGGFTKRVDSSMRNTLYVWAILGGSAVGLLASTMGRLYASPFTPCGTTRTPMHFAIVRVALTSGLGYLCSVH